VCTHGFIAIRATINVILIAIQAADLSILTTQPASQLHIKLYRKEMEEYDFMCVWNGTGIVGGRAASESPH